MILDGKKALYKLGHWSLKMFFEFCKLTCIIPFESWFFRYKCKVFLLPFKKIGTLRVASYQNAIQGLGLKVELLLYFDISKVELGRYEIVKEQCTWNKSGTKHERENIAAS